MTEKEKEKNVLCFVQKLWSCPLQRGCMGQNEISVYETINLKTFTIIQCSSSKVLFQSILTQLCLGLLKQWPYCTERTRLVCLLCPLSCICCHIVCFNTRNISAHYCEIFSIILDFCAFSLAFSSSVLNSDHKCITRIELMSN